jgi:IclR family pca regulon transcriptional regulator
MSVTLDIGTKLPAYCTSMGRVLLAALPDDQLRALLNGAKISKLTAHTVTDRGELLRIITKVRENGYAVVDQELELGLRSIAVPLRDRRGTVRAAVNISAHTSRSTPKDLTGRYLSILNRAADKISKILP